ncbi:MAG: prepilin-type N-terminal cleavage/methylation domain-containing protein [Myxococcota bacterium]
MRKAGFTLLEMLAVLLLIGLVASLALPNLAALSGQALRDEARHLATELERARERSVVTGVRHQLVLDLDAGRYWTEWESELAEAPLLGGKQGVAGEPRAGDEREAPHVALSAPARERHRFTPLPDRSGRATALDGEVFVAAIELDSEVVDRGVLELPFESDGSSDPARILLSLPEGTTLTLELLPLADAVRIFDEQS